MGRATGHIVVGLCICVCMFVCICLSVGRISRRSLKSVTQAKVDICLKMNCKDFGYKGLFVSYGVIAYLAIAGDLVSDVKTKLSTAGCLTASEFVFTSEQHGRLVYEAACILELWHNFAYLVIDGHCWRSRVLCRQYYPQLTA